MTEDTGLRWVATLSDGSTVVENSGDFVQKDGERKPWVRLTEFAADKGVYLTSLRLNFKGRTIHLPRQKFDLFNLGAQSLTPSNYSLHYVMEKDLGSGEELLYIDLVAHFTGFEVHYVQDINEGNNSWIAVTQGHEALAPSPIQTTRGD